MFKLLAKAANPALSQAQEKNKVVVTADPAECSFQFNPTGTVNFTSSCDIAKQALAGASVSYAAAASRRPAVVKIGEAAIPATDPRAVGRREQKMPGSRRRSPTPDRGRLPGRVQPVVVKMAHDGTSSGAPFTVVLILIYLVILVTMVYGPIAAMLVEMFPTRIRYTSMRLPYHIGNGWFGGLLPTTAFAIVAQTGNMYNGLWYPIIIAAATVVIGMIFMPETKNGDIFTHGDATEPRPGDPIVEFEPMAPDV